MGYCPVGRRLLAPLPVVAAGDELLISYSDAKPNEELLMLHGFVESGSGGIWTYDHGMSSWRF